MNLKARGVTTTPDRQAVAQRIRSVSQLSGSFTLRSGVVSDTYFDKFLFESDPELLRDIATLMAELLPELKPGASSTMASHWSSSTSTTSSMHHRPRQRGNRVQDEMIGSENYP